MLLREGVGQSTLARIAFARVRFFVLHAYKKLETEHKTAIFFNKYTFNFT